MKRQASKALAFILVILASGLSIQTSAISITFQPVDVADLAPGEDLWQGIIRISDATFAENEGFTIYLPADTYFGLSGPSTVNAGWDLITIEPDLGADGYFDGLSLVSFSEIASPFTFNFVYSGPGSPDGAYQYETYNNVPFAVTASGFTTLPQNVPEAGSSLLLLGLALLGLFSAAVPIGRQGAQKGAGFPA